MNHRALVSVLLSLSACAPLPTLPELDASPDGAAPDASALSDASTADSLTALELRDDDVASATYEYRAGECVVQFDPTSWVTTEATLRVGGRVRCDARAVTDRVALESTEGGFLANAQCSVPRAPVILTPGNGAADGTRFQLVLGGAGAGLQTAELVLRNTQVTRGVTSPADELRRFVVNYVTGIAPGGRAPEGMGPHDAFGVAELTALARSYTAQVVDDVAPIGAACATFIAGTGQPKVAAGCALALATLTADAARTRALTAIIARVPGLSISRRAELQRLLEIGLVARGSLGILRTTRSALSSLTSSWRAAPAVLTSHGAESVESLLGYVDDAATVYNTLTAWSDPPRAEDFTARDGRVGATVHLSIPAPVCSATRVTAEQITFTLVSSCGNRRCDAGETWSNCASDCAAPTPTLRVVEPTGGTYAWGQGFTLRWVGANLTTPVRLVVRRNGVEFATASTTAPSSGSQWIGVNTDWQPATTWDACATAQGGVVWSCSPRFEVRAPTSLDAGVAADVVAFVDAPRDAGVAAPDVVAPPADVVAPPPADVVAPPPADVVTPPPADVVAPPPADVVTPPPADVVAPSDTASPPSVSPRLLRIELDASAHAECPGGWTLVTWDTTGAPRSAEAPGRALTYELPETIGDAALGFGAQCAATGAWRVWLPWLGRSVRDAGVRSVSVGGVERASDVLVCDPPWHPRAWQPEWRVQPIVGFGASRGRCP